VGEVEAGRDAKVAARRVMSLSDEVDAEFLRAEVPAAIERAIDGIGRVSRIVRAMKAFAHPGQSELAPADLNAAIETTLTVARNEYRYVADVETHFGDVPQVYCNIGDINQVVLNLIVNAAHAIEARVRGTDERGRIDVTTTLHGNEVLVRIADTGCGIPDAARARVFDPFFTTKEVGKGTGQGLSLAYNIIVTRHGGRITFETEEGVGTTFQIALPLGKGGEVRVAA
jgi:two-component system NtrC family sensor kinase